MMIWASLAIIVLLALELFLTPRLHSHLSAASADLTTHIIVIALIVAVAVLIDALIRHFYWRGYLKRRRGQDTPALIQDIVTILLVTAALSIGLSIESGLSIGGIATASGATAIVLGLALQTVIQDLFSGLAINFDGSYAIGDWLTVYTDQMPESLYGQVTSITWRSTYLRLEDGRRLMIPNRMVTSNPVMNHSRPRDTKRIFVEVVIDNRIPTDRVTDMLLGEAFKMSRHAGLARHPEPDVLVKGMDSDRITYEVRFHHDPDKIHPDTARSVMLNALVEVIQQNKLPTPVSQVELTQPPDLAFELGEEEERSLIERAPLFRDILEKEHVDILIAHCRPSELPVGSVLMQQGDEGGSMFIIMEGAANVAIRNDSGQSHEVNILATGDVVGEMSLMTGSPRTATVTALTEMRVLEIPKTAMELLFQKSPGLAERFSHVLAERLHMNADLAHRMSLRAAAQDDLLARIRTFFSRAFS
jgi:small-conductance mechanosensitive channel/CRP-like cAMP-binding protein